MTKAQWIRLIIAGFTFSFLQMTDLNIVLIIIISAIAGEVPFLIRDCIKAANGTKAAPDDTASPTDDAATEDTANTAGQADTDTNDSVVNS